MVANLTVNYKIAKTLNILPNKSIYLSQDLVKFATHTESVYLNFPNGKTAAEFVPKKLNSQSNKEKINSEVTKKVADNYTKPTVMTLSDFQKLNNTATITKKQIIKVSKNFNLPRTASSTITGIIEDKKTGENPVSFTVGGREENYFTKIFSYFGI